MAIREAKRVEREYKGPEVDMTLPMAELFQTKINTLNSQFTAEIKEINETLLSLATHVQNINTKEKTQLTEMLIWDENEIGISWKDKYKGSSIFLVCSGPSLNDLDLSLLDNRGVMTMAINNSWSKVKPNFWMGFDTPKRFHTNGWLDPSIIKFVPWQHKDVELRHRVGGQIVDIGKTSKDVPNCWYVSNNTTFDADKWFTEPTLNWGGRIPSLDGTGYRATMIGALRMLHYLGFKDVYLIGCDWNMDSNAYAWEENRTNLEINSNNRMYEWMEKVLTLLEPGFKESDFNIYNCTPHSKLSLYPHVPYEKAIASCTISDMENLRGWYQAENKVEYNV
tara:strand:- start:273 stop:1283 length:1011 start_codon:yes stop_codon:yes gene_type:complete